MDTSDWIALSAVVIALSALGTSLWQGYVARKHNKLSVRPWLKLDFDSRIDLIFSLSSHGLGPAIIKDFVIYFNGKEFINPSSEIYDEILDYLEIPWDTYESYIPSPGESWSPSTQLCILKVNLEDGNVSTNFQHILGNGISYKIFYTSVYQDEVFSDGSHWGRF